MGKKSYKRNTRRVSNKQPLPLDKQRITNLLENSSESVRESASGLLQNDDVGLWKCFEKGSECTGEAMKCTCGKLHLYQICDNASCLDYKLYEHVMASKWSFRLKPYFLKTMGSRKLLWAQLAYNLLLTSFRAKMTEGAYAYYEFSFPGTPGDFQSKCLPHSVLTPKYLANTVFPAVVEDSLLVEPFYIRVYAINMDNLEGEDDADFNLQQLKCFIQDLEYLGGKDLAQRMDSTASESIHLSSQSDRKPTPQMSEANVAHDGNVNSTPEDDCNDVNNKQTLRDATSRIGVHSLIKHDILGLISKVDDLECHLFGPGKYRQQKVTLTDTITKLQCHKLWLCEIANTLMKSIHSLARFSYSIHCCYEIILDDAFCFSSDLKDIREHDAVNDWTAVFSTARTKSPTIQFELRLYFVDLGKLEKYEAMPLDFVILMKLWFGVAHNDAFDPFTLLLNLSSFRKDKHSVRKIKMEALRAALIKKEAIESPDATAESSTFPDATEIVTNSAEEYGSYFFRAEHFKNNTELAEKARKSRIPASAVYKILSWYMRPHTSNSLGKHFTVEINQQFVDQAKDQKLAMATVCCDIERNNGQCWPSQAKRVIGIRLASGKEQFTLGMCVEAELNPEVARNKLFGNTPEENFFVGDMVEIDVEWRSLS